MKELAISFNEDAYSCSSNGLVKYMKEYIRTYVTLWLEFVTTFSQGNFRILHAVYFIAAFQYLNVQWLVYCRLIVDSGLTQNKCCGDVNTSSGSG